MVDILRAGEHKIVLGESLKDGLSSDSGTFLGLKYNWIPKSGLVGFQGRLKQSKDSILINYKKGDKRYTYASASQQTTEGTQLVLVHDSERSVFVVEKIVASIDLNLQSATGQTTEQINKHIQLKQPQSSDATNGHQTPPDDEIDWNNDSDFGESDQENPYDYRHWLPAAKKRLENEEAQQTTNGTTPFADSNTPRSGFSSPTGPARNHFLSTTPQFSATEITNEKRKVPQESMRRRFGTSRKGQQQEMMKRKLSPPSKRVSSKVLSQERVQDSSSDSDEHLARPNSRSSIISVPNHDAARLARNRSPHIVVQDGDLEIDEGSPTRQLQRKKPRINPSAFGRSGTNTPTIPYKQQRPSHDSDVELRNAHTRSLAAQEEENDEEENPYFKEVSDDELQRDSEIEIIDLGEPAPQPKRVASPEPLDVDEPTPAPARPVSTTKTGKARRKSSTNTKRQSNKARSPSPLPQPGRQDTEDDDGGLADMLAAALEAEDGEDVGLGVSGAGLEDMDADADESEISEED